MSMNFFKIFRASVRDAGGGGSRNGGWLKEASMTVTTNLVNDNFTRQGSVRHTFMQFLVLDGHKEQAC